MSNVNYFFKVSIALYRYSSGFIQIRDDSTDKKARHVKTCLRAYTTAKVQISPCIHTVWSGPSLSARESLNTTEYMNWEQQPGWYFAYAQDYLNQRV